MAVAMQEKYRYRPGHEIRGIDAQVVGETIQELQEAREGRVTPAEIVEEARPDDHPLHEYFEWDVDAAAQKYNEDQARRLIRSYYVIRIDDAGREREYIANVSVARNFDRDGPAYSPAASAMEDPDLRARIVRLAEAQLQGWEARYAHLGELAAYVDAIRAARARRQGRQRPAPPPAPARPRPNPPPA